MHTIDAANNTFYISLTADRNATSLTQIVVSEELKIQKMTKMRKVGNFQQLTNNQGHHI